MSYLKVIGIGGPPGVGKTTLMYSLIARLSSISKKQQEVRLGLCRGRYFYPPQNVYVLGVYDGSMFSGTDKLSMACHADCERFIQWVATQADTQRMRTVVLFEGDRLFTKSYIQACLAVAPRSRFVTLTDSPEALEERRAGRRLDRGPQYEVWLKGRLTKIHNIEEEFGLEPLQWEEERWTAGISSLLYRHVTDWLDAPAADVPLDTRNLREAQP